MTRDEIERRARIRQKRRKAMIMRRIIAAVVLVLILIPVLYGVYSHHKVKVLKKNINTLEKQMKDGEQNQNGLQKQIDDLQQQLKEKEEQLQVKMEATTDHPDQPNIYLTFDDGPSANTDIILDTLKKYNVRATFFCIAQEGEENLARYKRIVAEGHTLGMHSYTHNYSQIYASLGAYEKDVTEISDFLQKATGVQTKFYRFPGGSSNTVSRVPISKCIKYLNEQGIVYFDWNAQNGDVAGKAYTASQLVSMSFDDINQDGDNVVLLMHDEGSKAETAKSIPQLIKKLKAAKYDILPITDATELVQHVKYDSVN